MTQVVHVDSDANTAPSCFTNSGFPENVPAGHPRTLNPSCFDDDGDAVSYTKLSEPAHGTLSDAGGTLVYTPTAGYTGPDQFNYKASDGHTGESAPTTYHVQVVTPSAPTCTPSSPATVRTNSFRSFFLSCSDAFGDPLTYVIDSQPAHGTLSGSGQSRFLSAGPDEGDATFTWHAHGPSSGDSATQTQVVTIDADANTAPTCQASSTNAKPGVQRTISPVCSDAEFDSLTYTKQTNPAHGTLTDTDGVLRYTADSGYLGADSFTFRASDGHGGQSGITTLSINVTTTNTAPSCFAGPYQYEVEAGTSILFTTPPCSDVDGDTLSYDIVTQPTHGTLSDPGPGGSRTYTADADYEGSDSFTFRAFDGTDHSATQTVSITVTPSTNGAPVCSTFSRSIAPGTATTIQLICSDPEGDPITLEKVAGPTHGTLGAIDQGTDQAIYTPDAGYNGVDSFTYRATDGTVTGATATVTLNVTRAPTCQNVARTTKVGTAVSIPLTCTDPDGDTLTLSKVTDPAHGTLGAISAGSVTYTPTSGYFGPDSFTYKANDGTANSTPATVSITVTRPASCSDVSRRTKIGTAVSVPLTCTDADGDALTLSIVNGPAHGTLGTISGGAVSYTPTADYFGADSFTFKASDGTAESAPATASITVTRAPSCADVSRKTAVGVAVSVPLSCTDPDGDSLTLSKVTDPAHGSLGAISGSSVTYTPTAGYFGADSFTYKASDGAADSPAATVSLAVTRPPTCDAVSRKTKVNTAVSVPLSCTDPDGDALTLSKVANPSKGTLGAISAARSRTRRTPASLGPTRSRTRRATARPSRRPRPSASRSRGRRRAPRSR